MSQSKGEGDEPFSKLKTAVMPQRHMCKTGTQIN